MPTGQQPRSVGEGLRDDGAIKQEDAGGGSDTTEGEVIFGIINIGSHDTLGSNGVRRGFMMCLLDRAGRKYYVDIPESTYNDLVGIYAVSMQGVPTSPAPVEDEPAGTKDEIAEMRKIMSQAKPSVEDGKKKLGFLADDAPPVQEQSDPVDDLLAMAASEEEFDDPGESGMDEEVDSL